MRHIWKLQEVVEGYLWQEEIFFVDGHQQKTVKVEKEWKMKQKHHVQSKEINCLQRISNEKLIKDSILVPRNKSLKIFRQNIRGLGNKANEL